MTPISDILINHRVPPTPELLAELENYVKEEVSKVQKQGPVGRAKVLSFDQFVEVMDLRLHGLSLNKISNRLLLTYGIEMTGDAIRSLTIGETYKDFHQKLKVLLGTPKVDPPEALPRELEV